MKSSAGCLTLCCFLLYFLFGCEPYSGKPDEEIDMVTSSVYYEFPWIRDCTDSEGEGLKIQPQGEQPDDYFFQNSRYIYVTLPCGNIHLTFYIEPDGKKHMTAGVVEARILAKAAETRGVPNRVRLPTEYQDVVSRGIGLFNRRLEFEDFILTPENVHAWASELLSMTHFGRKIVDDSLSYIYDLPPEVKSNTGGLSADANEAWWKRIDRKIHPLYIRFTNNMYYIHFFFYGGDVKEWKVMALIDGTVVNYNLSWPFGIHKDFIEDIVIEEPVF